MPFKPEFLIIYFTTIVWAVIPFRQYRKKYFYYFYFNNIGDYLTLYARFLFHSQSNFFYVPTNLLMLISIQEASSIKKYKAMYLTGLLVLSILYFYLNTDENFILDALIYFLILITLSKDFIKIFFKERIINLFIAVIILDAAISMLRYLGVISGASNGYFYFYASIAFEILIGFFFWIKADNPRLLIKLRKIDY